MRYKLTFVVGFATGYTLGAKAGRERYEQISRVLHGLAESPTVQSAAGMLQAQASKVVDNARSTLLGKLPIGAPHERDPYGPGPVPAMNGHGRGTSPPH